jgi:predicted SnoaL-like aldol condensation-catalyzing enzyme
MRKCASIIEIHTPSKILSRISRFTYYNTSYIVAAEVDEVFAMLTTQLLPTNKQTGKRVTIKSADLYRIENDRRIVEHWDVVDEPRMA